MFSSQKTTWNTPAWLFEEIEKIGSIILDPCWNDGCPIHPPHTFVEEQNGLLQDWNVGPGVVYVNPPYGRQADIWSQKIYQESGRVEHLVALMPARVDTRWFHEYISKADVLCFIKGRLRFGNAKNSAPFPSLVAYWGSSQSTFLSVFSNRGACFRRARVTEKLDS